MPTKIVFSGGETVVVVDEPHEVQTKLEGPEPQLARADGSGGIRVVNPSLILYLERVDR